MCIKTIFFLFFLICVCKIWGKSWFIKKSLAVLGFRLAAQLIIIFELVILSKNLFKLAFDNKTKDLKYYKNF